MNVIGTGLSGLVGSRIVELLKDVSFQSIALEKGMDITNHSAVFEAISKSTASWVVHLAAYTDVQGAETEREKGKDSVAWKVNVEATKNIVDICHTMRKRLLYVDTDYAFDGTKKLYIETDPPNPQSWYAITKTEGAKHVLSLGEYGLVIRIANPYRANFPEQSTIPASSLPVGKKDFVHKMIDRFIKGDDITAATDQVFVPTFVDDIAFAMDALLHVNAYGIYHVVGSDALTPYDVATEIARQYGFDPAVIKKTTFHEYFANRAPVPQYAALSNKKLQTLGVLMKTFQDGLMTMKEQECTL